MHEIEGIVERTYLMKKIIIPAKIQRKTKSI